MADTRVGRCVTIPSQFIEQDGGGNALEPPTHPSTAASKSRATPRRWTNTTKNITMNLWIAALIAFI